MTTITNRFLKLTLALGLVALVPLLAACAQATDASSGVSAPASAPRGEQTTTATIELVEPTEGAEVPAGTITVRVETTGLKYTMPSNTNVPGEGHIHFTLDDRPFVMSTESEAQLEDVEPGPHTLRAELVENNTQSFDPPIEAIVEFTAK